MTAEKTENLIRTKLCEDIYRHINKLTLKKIVGDAADKSSVTYEIVKICESYASQSRWISCEERLPESGQCVLIYSEDGGVAEGCYVASENHYDQFRWSCTYHQNDVSHWQPLPQPPKQ